MSNEKPSGTTKPAAHASKSSGMKWLGGAALAAVLLGGGYYAWSLYGQPQPASTNQQYDTQTAEAPLSAGALPQRSASNAASPAASSPSTQTADATAPRRRANSQANSIPEETIGVTPARATADDGEAIIVQGQRRPLWTHTPSRWRLAETYPARALEEGREGEASLQCTVLSNGALRCAQVSEYPARAGFGGAALRVAHMYRHASTLRNGRDAVGSPVNLRVVFRVDDNTRRG